jgi:lipopolysaccharide heptosyltransferase II
VTRPQSILIIQTAFIGDVILATALIESLHARFPDAQIDFVVRKGNEPLLSGHPYLRNVLVFDKAHKYRNLVKLIVKIRKLKFDYVINVQRFATTGIITALSGAKNKIGFDKNPISFLFTKKVHHYQEGPHETERNHKLIEALVGLERRRPALYPSPTQFDRVAEFKTAPYVTVSPASVWFTKQFPKEKWIEFLEVLPKELSIYLLGGGGDADICESIRSSVKGKPVVNLAGKLSLLESAALMRGAEMNFVNDSAPMHLASAMNAPVTAVYGSTIPAFGFGPLSDKSFIVETVETLHCRPCGLHGRRECPEGHFACMLSIQKEQLLATVVRVEPPL